MEAKKLNVLITGSTGMVGEGVLLVCLQNPAVGRVTVVNRRSVGFAHPKLTEIIHPNFYNLSSIENRLTGFDACYFCLGVSSVGMNMDDYFKITYTLTMHFGETLCRLNPGMVFCYVAGAGTNESGKGVRWARIKGKTENDLDKLPFKAMYRYRFGFIKPLPGQKHVKSFYKYIKWIFPIGEFLYPDGFNTLKEVGLSMIQVTLNGSAKKKLAGRAITSLATQ